MTCRSYACLAALAFWASSCLGNDESGFVTLFNGRDLTGWSADPERWRVEDGAIVGATTADKPLTKGNTFAIWQGSADVPKELENFEVRVRYRFDIDASNSGIQFRSRLLPEVTPWTIAGYQYDIGWSHRLTASMYGERSRGALAGVGQKVIIDPAGRRWVVGTIPEAGEIGPHVRVHDWNDAAIRAVGNRIEFFHNGRKSLEVVDHDDRTDAGKGRALAGLLALQLHAGPPMQVRFSDVRVKLLPPGALVTIDEEPVRPGATELLPSKPKPKHESPKSADPRAADARREKAAALMKEVTPPEGFDASLFATSAEANYPVFVAATPDGTLFVSSDGNGSIGRDPHRGRIIRLRDSDGDGAADEVKEFVADLDSPRGLVWVDDRLVVLHPPHVSSFRDTDGDGVADERTLLVRGIAFDYSKRSADHTSNGLSLGIDGWVYAAIGDFGFVEAAGADGRRLQLRGGGLVRFRPDGFGLDFFARGTRNTLEAAVSPLLDMIARDNTNDGGGWNVRLHAFTGFEDHGYPRRYMRFADEIIAPLADYGGGSGTGACWIDEPWMPAALNDAAFTCDWGRGQIYRHVVTAKGAGSEATQHDFLGITRVTDLDVDAIGHVYAASWLGATFRWNGPDVGFIVRLTPRGVQPAPLPDVATATAKELAAILAGPSLRLRLEAQRALLRRGLVAEATAALEKVAADRAARPADRVAAMFTLALGRKADAVPMLAVLADDSSISAWAIRALGDLAAEGVAVPSNIVHAALASTDARTRKEAVVATVRLGMADSAARLLPLSVDSDPIVTHTVVEGLVWLSASREADVIAACAQALDDPSTPAAVHRAAARILGEIHSDPAADAVVTRFAATTDPSRRADLAWAAARLWQRESIWTGESWGTRPDTKGPYFSPERWSSSDRLEAVLLNAVRRTPLAELPALARTLGLHRLPAEAVVPLLLARATPALVTFLDESGAVPPPLAIVAVADVATSSAVPMPVRRAALRVLARSDSQDALPLLVDAIVGLEAAAAGPADVAAARMLARESTAAVAHLATLAALATKSPAHAALVDDMLLSVAGSSTAKSAVRGDAAARLAEAWNTSAERRSALVAASVRTGAKVLATRLVAAADQQEDAALRTAAAAAIKTLGINAAKVREIFADTGPKVGEQPAEHVIKLVDRTLGDRAIGMELFVAKKCVACHATGVDGTGLGPSLANAAGIYNRQQLAQSVLQPNKSIAQGFTTTALLLDDGRQLVGFVTSEGADRLTLRDAQGVEHAVDTEAIEERKKLPTSIMPEGLVSDLSIGEFASLIDFIESIGK